MYIQQTERLRLRQMSEDDAELMLGILTDPDFIRYVGDRGVRSIPEAADYIREKVLSSYRQYGFSMYLVELIDGSTSIGICGLVKRPGLDHVDIGFGFLPAWRKHGYAYEAAVGVLAYAASKLSLQQVVAIVSPENKASIGLLEKLGFQFDQMIRMSGDDQDTQLFMLQLGNVCLVDQ